MRLAMAMSTVREVEAHLVWVMSAAGDSESCFHKLAARSELPDSFVSLTSVVSAGLKISSPAAA